MISALARAAQVLDEPRYLTAALDACRFIRTTLYSAAEKTLFRRYRAGQVAIPGFVDDYAALIQALLDVYEASFEVEWLQWAVDLQHQQDALFWDEERGGYFATGQDPSLLLRMREDYDGAEPSPNSTAAVNLLRLWRMTNEPAFRRRAEQTVRAFGHRLQAMAEAVPQMAVALDLALSKPKEIFIAGEPGAEDTQALLRVVHEKFVPQKVLLLVDGGEQQAVLASWLPFIDQLPRRDAKATAYVCENYACNLPVTTPEELRQLLG
jgi:uncharacterized protein YyaL (SSP411 family)